MTFSWAPLNTVLSWKTSNIWTIETEPYLPDPVVITMCYTFFFWPRTPTVFYQSLLKASARQSVNLLPPTSTWILKNRDVSLNNYLTTFIIYPSIFWYTIFPIVLKTSFSTWSVRTVTPGRPTYSLWVVMFLESSYIQRSVSSLPYFHAKKQGQLKKHSQLFCEISHILNLCLFSGSVI